MILCLGTTPTVQRTMTFARLVPDAVNRAADVRETASGKSINVARTLATLGVAALATGFLGGDAGRFVREDLDRAGVRHDFVPVAPRTRTCTTVIDRAGGGDGGGDDGGTVTELVEESAPVPESAYAELLDKVRALCGAGAVPPKVMILSGSLTPGAPADFYARCARLAAGVPVVLDGRGEPLRLALAERPTVVKPNRGELEETVGRPVEDDAQLRRAVRELLDRGPRFAVITMGRDGAVACDGRTFWRVRSPRVSEVNPIGSGDAFTAGVASKLADCAGDDDWGFVEACRLGAACGTANALNTPAGHARREDVERLLPLVGIERMGEY